MGFLKIRAVPVVVIALLGPALVALASPTEAAVTTSNVTSPVNGTHYMVTDDNPATSVTVAGTTNGTTGDFVDLRCYELGSSTWQEDPAADNVAVAADGSFSTSMSTSTPYGSCRLLAVPHGLAPGSSVAGFSGPVVTTEYVRSYKIASGINAGKTVNYYVEFQGAHALNDYGSATQAGLWDSRLSNADGSSSNYLWYRNASLEGSDGARTRIRIDGHDAYGPNSANGLFWDIPGFPQLTFSASRNGTTGVTTIHETDPMVACPTTAPSPPTAETCPKYHSTGVRLERTIVATDGGLQVHFTDVWRSTDGKPHSISAYYFQTVQGFDATIGVEADTSVGLKLPWLGGFQTFAGDATYAGPAKLANTIFLRDSNTAADGDTDFPRGAITFDFPLTGVHRSAHDQFTMQGGAFTVAAGGTRTLRQSFVMGTTDAEVAAKAAANEVRLNPYRTDAMVKKVGAAAYTGNGIYNTTGVGQTVTASTKRTRTATFLIAVQNDGTQPTFFKIKGAGAVAGFTIRYLKGASGSKDITSAVTSGTYRLRNVAPGQSQLLQLVVTVKRGVSIGTVRSWLVQATSTNDPTRKDAIRAKVRVRS